MNRLGALPTVLLCGLLVPAPAHARPIARGTEARDDLAERYPTSLESEDVDPARAREWTFGAGDIYELASFALTIGKSLTIETSDADLGVGHCDDGAVWAIVIPRSKGHVTSTASETEAIEHVWLRFHPRQIGTLFPADTVRGPGERTLASRMQRIARFKVQGSYHAGGRAMIPAPSAMTVDVDTTAGRRRFFVVDREAGTADYKSSFSDRAIRAPKPVSKDVAAESFDQLWESFDRDYAMFVLRPKVDWKGLREEFRREALACKTSLALAEVCADMLRPLRDLHIWIKAEGEPVEVFNRPRACNANAVARAVLIGQLTKARGALVWGKTNDRIGYVAIDGWSDEAVPEAFDRVLDELRDTRGLIIDVRLNGGGNETLAQRVAARFADRTIAYGFSQYRNGPRHEDLTEKLPRTIEPRGPWRYDRPIVVLIGQRCMSSNESFVAMMGECPQVTTMGDHTCGSSGNPKVLNLPAGVEVSLPRWIDLLPDGTPLDERGVQPDVPFEPGPEAFTGDRDDLLSAALERLRKVPLPAKPVPAPQTQPDRADIAALWRRVLAANRAWLDPAPAAISFRVDSFDRVGVWPGEGPSWRRAAEGEISAAEGRNAHFLRRLFAGDGETIENETRFVRGAGGEVKRMPTPPSQRSRPLQDPEWLAARIGVPLWTSLHLAAVAGLPPAVTHELRDGRIVIRTLSPPEGAPQEARVTWVQWQSRRCPQYGQLLSWAEISPGLIDAVEWELDAATLRPRQLLERSATCDIRVEFGETWLSCGPDSVPGRIVVSNVFKQARTEIAYEMQCVDGHWVLKEALKRVFINGRETEATATRVAVREVSCAPIDDARFELPMDVDLPEHSYTELKPGERIVAFETADGLTLEAKLSLPPGAAAPVPVVMFLPGSGPWTFDRPVRIPEPNNMFESVLINYLDLYAQELGARGIGFFRANKRGCAQIKEPPHMLVRRAVFSKTTPSVLLEDHAAGLAALRAEAGVDPNRIVLMGMSEGTVLASRLAARCPAGVVRLVLAGYAEDNTRDTVTWQLKVGPWRNMARVYDLDNDDRITPAEWRQAEPDGLFRMRLGSGRFEDFDHDMNGVLEPKDLAAINAGRLEVTLKAVRDGDDDWLWWNLVNLNAAHLRADWDRAPLHEELLKLRVPIHIVHGTHDGTVRMEGVRETEAAFRAAGRSNLVVHAIERGDHDLGYGDYLAAYFAGRPQIPAAMQVLFDAAAGIARPQPQSTSDSDRPPFTRTKAATSSGRLRRVVRDGSDPAGAA